MRLVTTWNIRTLDIASWHHITYREALDQNEVALHEIKKWKGKIEDIRYYM